MTDIDKARAAYEAMIPATDKAYCPACRTEHHPNFPCKRGPGQPPKGPERKIKLPQDRWDWLAEQGKPYSDTIKVLIDQARKA